jgi:hypothetical protein
VAAVGGAGLLQLSCGSDELGQSGNVSARGGEDLAWGVQAPKPTCPDDLGAFGVPRRPLAPSPTHPAPLSRRVFRRYASEVGAV